MLVKYHHSLNSALLVMENLLRNLRYQMFTLVAADNAVRAVGATRLMEEYFDSSNFGVNQTVNCSFKSLFFFRGIILQDCWISCCLLCDLTCNNTG